MFRYLLLLVVFLPLAQQPTVGFGLSNNVLPFFPICDQLSPSSHSQHLKISFYFLLPSFPGSSLLLVPSNFWVKIFWASYPPPFSLGDLTSLSFALLSTAPQTAANKQWRHTGVWLCIISDKTLLFINTMHFWDKVMDLPWDLALPPSNYVFCAPLWHSGKTSRFTWNSNTVIPRLTSDPADEFFG